MDELPSIYQFIERFPVGLGLELVHRTLHHSYGRPYHRRSYTVTLFVGDRYLQVPYSCGDEEPELADILDCLASDCQSINGRTVREFTQEFCYDQKEGSRIYHAIEAERKNLRYVLGRAAYNHLVYFTERM